MKLGSKDEARYVGTMGSVALYEVALEGRPVIRIMADLSDPNRRIMISKPNGTGVQHTNGVFSIKVEGEELIEDADGNPVGVVPGAQRVSGVSVYRYVLPRLHRLIARVYVPIESA
jgi:hypothetical protein